MHQVGDEQRRHKKGRSKAEKFFKSINMIILAIHAGCLLIPLAYCLIAAESTFEGSFLSPGDFVLTGGYFTKTRDCVFETTLDTKGFNQVPLTLTADTHYRIIAHTASSIRTAFVMYAIALGLGAATKLLFDGNFFALRIRHFVLHKEIISTLEITFIMLTYYYVSTVEPYANKVDEYFRYCGVSSDSVFSLPAWPALYVGTSVCFAVHCFGFVSYLHTACFTKTDKLSGIPADDSPAGIQRIMDHQYTTKMENLYGVQGGDPSFMMDPYQQQQQMYPQKQQPDQEFYNNNNYQHHQQPPQGDYDQSLQLAAGQQQGGLGDEELQPPFAQ